MCVRARQGRTSSALMRHAAIPCVSIYHAEPLRAIKMSPPPLPTVTVAYSVDGQWHVQRMNVMAVFACFLPSPGHCAVRQRKAKRAPPACCPSSQALAGMLEELCASGSDDTLQVQRNLHVRLERCALLSACRLGGGGGERERFGKLAHWSALVETLGAPNLVMYACDERQFFVVCPKSTNTQPVNTRSAICWLRTPAGLGFCVHENGVFRILVSRRADSDEDPWSECLTRLVSAVPDVFPECSFDDEG